MSVSALQQHAGLQQLLFAQGQMFAIKRSRCKINDRRSLDATAAAAGARDTAAVQVPVEAGL